MRIVRSAEGRPWVRVIGVLVALIASMLAVVGPRTAALADAANKGGDYVPLPVAGALLDTRNNTGGVTGPVGNNVTVTFPVLGRGGVPESGVSAVLVDVTVVAPTMATYLTLWPHGGTQPNLSMVNATPGQIISNSAVVGIGTDGRVAVRNDAGDTHISIDVQGYFTETSSGVGGGFVPLNHTRLVDTRGGQGEIPAWGSKTFKLSGGQVPADAAAVFLDIIVTDAENGGWLAAYPTGGGGGRSVVDFIPGTTAHGAVVRLSSDGNVTFVNNSGSPVSLVLTAEGYFRNSSTVGAGLRTVPASRLVDTRNAGSPIPAHGTIDVPVGGTNGLPTRGVAGAVLNLTVTAPTAVGHLKAWPADQPEPASSLVNFAGGETRAGLAVVKLGTEAKVRIKNFGSGTAHVIVDLQGWFADPLPTLSVTPNSRISVMQAPAVSGASLGALEYAYVDNIGQARHARQTNVDNFTTVQWTAISQGPGFTGQPALSSFNGGQPGQMQVAAQNRDGDVWSINQTTAGGPAWSSWNDLGGSMASPPVAATLADGTTVLFAVDADGRLWHLRSASAGWRSLGDADLTAAFTAVPVQNGFQIFSLDLAGAVKTANYTSSGGLSGWTALGAAGSNGTPAAVVYPGYSLRVFVRAANGSIITKAQDGNGAWPAQWQTVGTFAAAGAPAAILDPLGRVTVVARGTDNEVYRSFETAQASGSWEAWLRINEFASDPAVTDPTVARVVNSSGETWIIVFRNINDATRVYERRQSALAAARSGGAEFVGHTLPAPPAQ